MRRLTRRCDERHQTCADQSAFQTWNFRSPLEKSFELRLRAMHAVIPFAELVIAEGLVDHFQPQNRLAFAFRIGWKANQNRTACKNADVAFCARNSLAGIFYLQLTERRDLACQKRTQGSNPSPSATQSEVQRNSAALS